MNPVSPGLMLTVSVMLIVSLFQFQPYHTSWEDSKLIYINMELRSSIPRAKVEGVKKKTTLGRLATVEEVARQTYCLAESESTTGTHAIFDGGVHLRR